MAKALDMTGKTFGRFTVLERAPRPEYTSGTGAWWLCRCSCGTEKVVYGHALRSGGTVSCGCQQREHLAPWYRRGRSA